MKEEEIKINQSQKDDMLEMLGNIIQAVIHDQIHSVLISTHGKVCVTGMILHKDVNIPNTVGHLEIMKNTLMREVRENRISSEQAGLDPNVN